MINPDIAPPRFLLDKLLEASFKAANHRYSVARGIRRAREAFASKYRTKFQVNLDPGSQVCVTLGTKDAMQNLLRVCKSRGIDRIVATAPMYQPICYAASFVGLEVATVSLALEGPDGECEAKLLADLGDTLRGTHTKVAVVLNFPNNPTGFCLSAGAVEQIVDLCHRHGALLINDFAYGELGYGDYVPPSFLASCRGASGVVETLTMSKAYSVPGWRVAALVGDPEIVTSVARLKSQVDYGSFIPFQLASAAALTSSEDLTFATRSEYLRRAKCLIDILSRLGWTVNEPRAGASVWARLPGRALEEGRTARGVAEELLLRGVAVSPEDAFFAGDGEGRRDGYIRFALVAPETALRQIGEKLEF